MTKQVSIGCICATAARLLSSARKPTRLLPVVDGFDTSVSNTRFWEGGKSVLNHSILSIFTVETITFTCSGSTAANRGCVALLAQTRSNVAYILGPCMFPECATAAQSHACLLAYLCTSHTLLDLLSAIHISTIGSHARIAKIVRASV